MPAYMFTYIVIVASGKLVTLFLGGDMYMYMYTAPVQLNFGLWLWPMCALYCVSLLKTIL